MVCKGICARYKATKSNFGKNNQYELGHKRCSLCEIFIDWDGRNCPCCGYVLKTKPLEGLQDLA